MERSRAGTACFPHPRLIRFVCCCCFSETRALAASSTRQIVLSCMVATWGLRLSLFLLGRILLWGEDKRFDDKREDPIKFAVFWAIQVCPRTLRQKMNGAGLADCALYILLDILGARPRARLHLAHFLRAPVLRHGLSRSPSAYLLAPSCPLPRPAFISFFAPFLCHCAQALWVWTVCLPMTLLNGAGPGGGLVQTDIAGWCMWGLGFLIEVRG